MANIRRCRRSRRTGLIVAVLLTAAEAAMLVHRRGRITGLDTVVRCRDGHLFTTIWLPGISLKALRLLWWRVQMCPVGRHWSLVTPAVAADLTPAQATQAAAIHDVRIP